MAIKDKTDTSKGATRATGRRARILDPNDLPDIEHPSRAQKLPIWTDLRILAMGTRAVWQHFDRFLLKHPAEETTEHARRAQMAELYNGFKRTIKASQGLVFARDPKPNEDAPAEFLRDWENIDGAGTHGRVFARKLFGDALTVGLAGIFIDYPTIPNAQAIDAAAERARGLRPYWVHVFAEDIISWRFTTVDGQQVLTQLVLREVREEPVGRFGTASCTYYRVYRREVTEVEDSVQGVRTVVADTVTWELWRVNARTEKPEQLMTGTLSGPSRIPFVPFALGDEPGTMSSEPPLQDLADVNLMHYRVATDRGNVMNLACLPVPVRKGYKPQRNNDGSILQQAIGPQIVIDVDENGDFFYRSPDAAIFGPTRDELQDKERRMGSLGLSFLFPETRATETATGKRIDATSENATLVTCATTLKDALEQAAQIHMEYRGVRPSAATVSETEGENDDAKAEAVEGEDTANAITFTVNTEFESVIINPQLAQLLSDMEAKGQLTLQTLFIALKHGHVLPDDFDGEDEEQKLQQKAVELIRAAQKLAPPTAPGQPAASETAKAAPGAGGTPPIAGPTPTVPPAGGGA